MQAAPPAVFRFPGGSAGDNYHWANGGTPTTGSGMYIMADDTFDNFMTRLVNPVPGATAMCIVNYGTNAAGTAGGDPNEAAAWVNYANNTKHYGVKYWEIGNEIYGNSEYGGNWEADKHACQTPTCYGQNAVAFIQAMKAKDPTIKCSVVLCAPGNWPDGAAPDWNTNVLAACGSSIEP